MKNMFKYILFLQFLVTLNLQGQVIDLRTGRHNTTGSDIPVNTADDTWKVSGPYGTQLTTPPALAFYGPVGCGTGLYALATANGLINYNYVGKDPDVMWLSPYLYPYQGNFFGSHLKANSVPNMPSPAYYYYQTTFNRPAMSCPITSATFRFKHIGVDEHVTQIFVNGTPIPIPAPGINYFSTDNFNIPIPSASGLFTSGSNTIVFEVKNTNQDWTGLEINGDLFIESCGYVDFALRDKDGNEKDEFCLEDNIFLDGIMAGAPGFTLELYEVAGSAATKISQQGTNGYKAGSPTHINIKELFETALMPVVFRTNTYKTYQVRLAINSSCGPVELRKNFHFLCCNNSTNSSFSLQSGLNPKLKGQGITSGGHAWTIYGLSQYTGEFISQTALKTYNTPSFSYNEGDNTCFFVKHIVNNDCGYSCTTQKLCSFPCPEKVCNLEAPIAQYNPANKALSWSAVSGAIGYVIVCIKNGCCNGNTGPVFAEEDTVTIESNHLTNRLYYFNLPITGGPRGTGTQCYSVRVYAKCPDGSLSLGSEPAICIQ